MIGELAKLGDIITNMRPEDEEAKPSAAALEDAL
jgi:hypothetical protein